MKTFVLFLGLFVLLSTSVHGERLVWEFISNEQQIKNGPESDGSTNSPGTGHGRFEFDTDSNLMSYTIQWDGLIGDLTKLHVHGPADEDSSTPQHVIEIFGPPAPPAELASKSGTWSDSFTLTTLQQAGFADLTPNDIVEIMSSGNAYLNVHSTVFGMGEIRGNLGIPIPEPSNQAILGTCLLSMIPFWRRIRR